MALQLVQCDFTLLVQFSDFDYIEIHSDLIIASHFL